MKTPRGATTSNDEATTDLTPRQAANSTMQEATGGGAEARSQAGEAIPRKRTVRGGPPRAAEEPQRRRQAQSPGGLAVRRAFGAGVDGEEEAVGAEAVGAEARGEALDLGAEWWERTGRRFRGGNEEPTPSAAGRSFQATSLSVSSGSEAAAGAGVSFVINRWMGERRAESVSRASISGPRPLRLAEYSRVPIARYTRSGQAAGVPPAGHPARVSARARPSAIQKEGLSRRSALSCGDGDEIEED